MILSNCLKLSSFLCETRIRVVKDDQESCSGHGKCCYDILASVDDDLVRFCHGSLVMILVIDYDLGRLFSRVILLTILVYDDFVNCLFFRGAFWRRVVAFDDFGELSCFPLSRDDSHFS